MTKKKKKILIITLIATTLISLFLIGFLSYSKKMNAEEKDYNSLNSKYEEVEKKYVNQTLESNFVVSDENGKVIKEVNGLEEMIKRKENQKYKVKKEKSKKEVQLEISKIQSLINNGEYQKFYDMFNKDYANDMNYTVENISRKYNFNGPINIEVKNFDVNQSEDTKVISVVFKNATSNFFTYLTFFNDGTIADTNIQYETATVSFKPITVDNVTYEYTQYYKGSDSAIYIIEITNNSEYAINILKAKAKKGTTELGATLGFRSIKEYYPSEKGKIQVIVTQSSNVSNIILEIENSCEEKKEIDITRY